MDGPMEKKYLTKDEDLQSQQILDTLMKYTSSEQEGTIGLLWSLNALRIEHVNTA
jgi:hypothetical protein